MSQETEKLKLFKYDSTDEDAVFNIDRALNDNWDKIEQGIEDAHTQIADLATNIGCAIENTKLDLFELITSFYYLGTLNGDLVDNMVGMTYEMFKDAENIDKLNSTVSYFANYCVSNVAINSITAISPLTIEQGTFEGYTPTSNIVNLNNLIDGNENTYGGINDYGEDTGTKYRVFKFDLGTVQSLKDLQYLVQTNYEEDDKHFTMPYSIGFSTDGINWTFRQTPNSARANRATKTWHTTPFKNVGFPEIVFARYVIVCFKEYKYYSNSDWEIKYFELKFGKYNIINNAVFQNNLKILEDDIIYPKILVTGYDLQNINKIEMSLDNGGTWETLSYEQTRKDFIFPDQNEAIYNAITTLTGNQLLLKITFNNNPSMISRYGIIW